MEVDNNELHVFHLILVLEGKYYLINSTYIVYTIYIKILESKYYLINSTYIQFTLRS
jgi:hypothetical protein